MRIVWMGLLWIGLLPLPGQTSGLPEAPVPVAAVSTSAPRDPGWERVQALPPGELIELRDRATGVQTECVLAYASASTVGCDTGGTYDPARRVVYPKAGIDVVWVVRWVHGPSGRAMLIGAGIGGVLGGVATRDSGSGGAVAAGVGLGSLIGLACSNLGDPFHMRMSKRRYRIYKSSQP